MFVVCYVLCVGVVLLFDVGGWLFVVVCRFVVMCWLCGVRWLLSVVCCSLFGIVVRCALLVAGCWFSVVGWLVCWLFDMCWLLYLLFACCWFVVV